MNFKLACADFTFPLVEHEVALKIIAMLGMQGVDIGLFEGRSHLWPSREFADVSANARHIKSKLNDLGLEAADIFLQMDEDFVPYAINHPESSRRAKARDCFSRTLEYASACGATHVTTLPGVIFNEVEAYDKSLGRAYEELEWRVDQSKSHRITFGTEAHVGSLAPTPVEAHNLIQAVPGLTLTLDYTHFTRVGVADEDIEPLIPLASHFHVRGAKLDRLQTTFAQNTIDYERVVSMMEQTEYSGWLGIEYVWLDWEHCNECDNLSETIQFRDFLRGLGR